ncbi:MAG: TlpA family protein disulfide reductase [Spirochaetia bacterium]|nr:TlpA family protein disulfide reductase [Spirochaetia bacterium]
MNKLFLNLKSFITRNKRDVIWWSLLILAIPIIQHWQTRNLLSTKQTAPDFTLYDIDGNKHSLTDYRGKPVLIYFFAPWCTVCKATSSNLTYLRKIRGFDKLAILSVGMSYNDQNEIISFAKDHGLSNDQVPVLLDDNISGENYKVNSFPTFYFIDAKGQINSNLTGYTTTAGLFLRSF